MPEASMWPSTVAWRVGAPLTFSRASSAARRVRRRVRLPLPALQGAAPYALRAMELGQMSDELDVALVSALAGLGADEPDAAELMGHAARAAALAMALPL